MHDAEIASQVRFGALTLALTVPVPPAMPST
jgi:hypothetical protein